MYCMVYAFLPVSMYVRTMYIMYTISYCRIIIAHLNQGYYYSWRPITVTQMKYISLSIDREFFFMMRARGIAEYSIIGSVLYFNFGQT